MVETAVVLLAGGEATRFPGKLEHRIDGRALVALAYDRARSAGWPVYVAGKGSFPSELDAHLEAPLLVDRRPGRGPLHAFLGACAAVRARRLFAVAADQPDFDGAVMRRLTAAWEAGDDAVVPIHDAGIEPLGALYDRRAALHAGFELRNAGEPGMRDLIARLAARFVRCDAYYFHNVNRREDLLER